MKIGEYVLATRWSDGSPHDPWAVGFLTSIDLGRYYVQADGVSPSRGFRRCQRISREEGEWILRNKEKIELSASVWKCLRNLRKEKAGEK